MGKLIATFDSIIVEPIKAKKSNSTIIVPDVGNSKELMGKIISIGPGKQSITGNFVRTSLQEGTIVKLPHVGPTRLEFEGKEYWGCPETMVLAIIEE
jgi:co-chaperonin GroES (HSP10)